MSEPQADDTQLGDDGQTPLEWADKRAELIGGIWLDRFPGGKDW